MEKNKDAEKFFNKKLQPGRMGEGFVYVNEKMSKEKPLKIFASYNDLVGRANK